MNWKKGILLILLLPSLFLGGCWDLKAIERIYYIDIMGFDYRDGKYHIYSKLTNFTLFSKSESANPSTTTMNWIGHGEGKTLHEAFFHLYTASEQVLSYGQLHAMVFTEDALRHGVLHEIIELFGRFHHARPTQWVFATSEPLEKILKVPPEVFIPSRFERPISEYRQRSWIRPVHMHEVLSKLYEPGVTLLLPRARIAKQWVDEKKPIETIQLNGVYSMYDLKLVSNYTDDHLAGLRWMTPQTNRGLLILDEKNTMVATIVFGEPNVKIKTSIQNGKPYFDIDLSVEGRIYMMMKPLSEERLRQLSSKKIEEQIRHTFEKGISHKDDLYSLSKELLNEDHNLWVKLNKEKKFFLDKKSLRSIHVNAKIKNSGALKLKDSGDMRPTTVD